MSSCKNEVDSRYGRLTVVSRNGHRGGNNPDNHHRKKAAWLCKCDCGKEITKTGEQLRSGKAESCGCLRLENVRKALCKPDEVKKATDRARRLRERDAFRLAKYGITPEEYQSLKEKQQGKCLLPSCDRPASALDHCHVTGKLRGLMCPKCNSMLGFADDSPARLREAATYLENQITCQTTL
jgi:hypothetical protein